ncbi:hypothetical protein MLD38_010856 [Melastoma candidum]|uniref:Uncharacterized protein n=1 Tax=Melastoma candidum TaxID=119954 RepID=A0ACB9R2B6_9MYRT|nr:hypothetical protein MLD38_010856 [Melastoma candidum]
MTTASPAAGIADLRTPSSIGGAQRKPKPALSIAKPSWLVRTESNVRREVRKKPEKPCVVCGGCGRVDCHSCKGKGRTNNVDLAMLPRGEWPKWCRACGGSGLEYCSRCLGTGEYRYIMGFKFMKPDADENDGSSGYPSEEQNTHRGSSDPILNNDEPPQRP